MKKFLLSTVFIIALVNVVIGQDLGKRETLAYIHQVYSLVNRFYITEYNYIETPTRIDSVGLVHDRLVVYFRPNGENAQYSGPRSATISGSLTLVENQSGIKNEEGNWVLRVQPQNISELKKLYFALLNLQKFIVEDPFASNVGQYNEIQLQEKRQREIEAMQREEQMRRLAEQERLEQQRIRERKRLEQEREFARGLQEFNNSVNKSIYGSPGNTTSQSFLFRKY